MNGRTTAALLALCACGTVEVPEAAAPASARQDLRLGREVSDCNDRDGIIIGNSLSTTVLMGNPLLFYPPSNDALRLHPLSTASLSSVPALNLALADPLGRSVEVMHYLVGCALPLGEVVSWTSPSGTLHQFHGEVGLCPDWGTTTPSTECLQAVSACLLGRNNHLGVHVPLSLRGDDTLSSDACGIASSRLRPWSFRERDPDGVVSYTGCSGSGPRDCGWQGQGVWACTPGLPVELLAGACGLGVGTKVMLRVCDGVSACDSADQRGFSYSSPCWDEGTLVNATCPASGRISVMSAPYHSGDTSPVTVEAASAGTYLLDERDQFPIREGAFYGTMFGPGATAYAMWPTANGWTDPPWQWPSPATFKVVFPHMYACSDERWRYGFARMWGADLRGRVCALGTFCASNYTGICGEPLEEASCDGSDTDDFEFRRCHGGGLEWTQTLTSFLDQPCALTDPKDPKRCERK